MRQEEKGNRPVDSCRQCIAPPQSREGRRADKQPLKKRIPFNKSEFLSVMTLNRRKSNKITERAYSTAKRFLEAGVMMPWRAVLSDR